MSKETVTFSSVKAAGLDPWECPLHNIKVVKRVRRRDDKETGKSRFAGEYFMCPHYAVCGYYIDGRIQNVKNIGQLEKP